MYDEMLRVMQIISVVCEEVHREDDIAYGTRESGKVHMFTRLFRGPGAQMWTWKGIVEHCGAPAGLKVVY